MRAVVLLELDQLHRSAGTGEIALEMLHVGDVRAAERVDRLIVVPDGEDRRLRRGQQLEPLVLQHVGILELVDQDVREAAPVVLTQALVPCQQLVGAQQQLRKVDDAVALARLLVKREMLDLAAGEIVVRLDLVRAQAFLLRNIDKPLKLAGRKALVVDVMRLVHPLDQRELILHVHDLELLGSCASR